MTDRQRVPAPPSGEELGGLTGATGSLTPDDPDGAFVPAETREMTDADAARDITAAAHRRREDRAAGASDERGGGYGSEHGLAADDPAYREEEHLPPPRSAGSSPASTPGATGPTRIGGDEVRSPEDEHL